MKTHSQPHAIYYVVALQIWEYFSFYGMRALLVLYLIHQLSYSDIKAFDLYSAYGSLVYVTPILGGLVADHWLGNRISVLLGAILMTLGHIVLGISATSPATLYLALAIIVCGYGLFKSNISCLLGELYAFDDPRREGGFSLLYAAGNIGSIIAPIACGVIAQRYGWHAGFALAGIGMFIGLLIFMSGHKHFVTTRGIQHQVLKQRRYLLSNRVWLLAGLFISPFLVAILFWQSWAGYTLSLVSIVACYLLVRIYLQLNSEHRHSLLLIIALMILGTLFWAFAQQGGSSITLFIDRFVDRHWLSFTIPSALFQSVNGTAVMVAGVVLAWLLSSRQQVSSTLWLLGKFALGLALICCGFALLTLAAHHAELHGQASMWITIGGLALMGVAELFIDPVAMAQITRLPVPGITGLLTGIYMLATGSIANYVAGIIANQTVTTHVESSSVQGYVEVFGNIGWCAAGGVAFILLLIVVLNFYLMRSRQAIKLETENQ